MYQLHHRLLRLMGALALLSTTMLTSLPVRAEEQPGLRRAAEPAALDLTWSVVSSPNGTGINNILGGIAVVSANDIWTVGNTSNSSGSTHRTLVEHWDGSGWSVVSSPNGSGPINYLTAAAATASNDVWAVGFSSSSSRTLTLIEHWDGASWSVISSPNTSRPSNFLYGVAAVSSSDVWAVGQSTTLTLGRTLIEHWDGTNWSIVSSPSPGTYGVLYGVTAVAADDVWAIGTHYVRGLQQSLVEHWDGTSWSVVSSPNVGPYLNTFLRIFATSASDIWAVGYHLAVFGFSEVYQTSVLHWDGTSWSVVPSPSVNQENNYLYDVVGLSADDAWAVGFFDTGTQLLTLIEHWDGTSWSIVSSPNVGSYYNQLMGIAAVSSSDIWSVGNWTNGTGSKTLIERATN